MKVILLDEKGEVQGIYDNPDVRKHLPQDRIVEADDETAENILLALADHTVTYTDGGFAFAENGNARRREICAEISELENWFIQYDHQIAQYQRAQRLGEAYDERYGAVCELDAKAKENAKRLSELRASV